MLVCYSVSRIICYIKKLQSTIEGSYSNANIIKISFTVYTATSQCHKFTVIICQSLEAWN